MLVSVREECVSGSKREDVRRLFLREECVLNIAMQAREKSSIKKKCIELWHGGMRGC